MLSKLVGCLLRPMHQLIARIDPQPVSPLQPDKSDSSSTIKWWEKSTTKQKIHMKFVRDVSPYMANKPANGPDMWIVYLDLKTFHLPSLMKYGLYIDPRNVKEWENYVSKIYSHKEERWSYCRKYTLLDPQWSGSLSVTSWSMKALNDFRIEDLSANLVLEAWVEKEEHNKKCKQCWEHHDRDFIYFFDLRAPDDKINCIFGNMPMDGLWPWPRRETTPGEGEDTKKQMSNDFDSETDPGMNTPDSGTDLETKSEVDTGTDTDTDTDTDDEMGCHKPLIPSDTVLILKFSNKSHDE